MIAGEGHERAAMDFGSCEVAPHQFERHGEQMRVGGGGDARNFGRSSHHFLDKQSRSFGFAQRPERARQIRERADAVVMPGSKTASARSSWIRASEKFPT